MFYYSFILKLTQMDEETIKATAYKMKKKNEANRNFHRVKQQLVQTSCVMTILLVFTLTNFILD